MISSQGRGILRDLAKWLFMLLEQKCVPGEQSS
jgi:hypothetical protein